MCIPAPLPLPKCPQNHDKGPVALLPNVVLYHHPDSCPPVRHLYCRGDLVRPAVNHITKGSERLAQEVVEMVHWMDGVRGSLTEGQDVRFLDQSLPRSQRQGSPHPLTVRTPAEIPRPVHLTRLNCKLVQDLAHGRRTQSTVVRASNLRLSIQSSATSSRFPTPGFHGWSGEHDYPEGHSIAAALHPRQFAFHGGRPEVPGSSEVVGGWWLKAVTKVIVKSLTKI